MLIIATFEWSFYDTMYVKEVNIYGSCRLGVLKAKEPLSCYSGCIPQTQTSSWAGKKLYELTNHLGNVLATVTDKHIPVDDDNDGHVDWYLPEVASENDYYPFGMLQPERQFNANRYKFGFNGQERIDEISGLGNHNTAEFWEYDIRLGRRWNLDPIIKTSESPYSCLGNNPIWMLDINGADTTIANNKKGNVIVWITETGNKVDYDKESKQKNWDIIEAKNSADAADRLKNYKGSSKINNLIVRTHGLSQESPSAFAFDDFDVNAKDVSNFVAGKSKESNEDNFLTGVKEMIELVDKKGSIYFTACNAGLDRALAGKMTGLLKNNSDVQLYFNTGRSQFGLHQYKSEGSQYTLFDSPLLHQSSSFSIWISVEKIQNNITYHFWKTSPGPKSSDPNPVGNYLYEK